MSRNIILFCLLALTAVSAQAGVIYGVGPWGSFDRASLYSIDTTTGEASVIGSTGVRKVGALSYNEQLDTLYIFTTDADLFSVDPSTGAATNVQYVSAVIGEGGLASRGGLLYTCDGSELLTIDPVSGDWTTVGDMHLNALSGTVNDISGLAFAPDGNLYGYTKNGTLEDSLIRINPDTAATELVGGLGIQTLSVGGLAYDADSCRMLLSDSASLYSVDLCTGDATLIGAHGAGISGLTYVPEPATAMLLVLGGLVGARRRWRN